jgi:xanthine dehydrogenase accessory factor
MTGATRTFYAKMAALGSEGESFVVATVVGRRAPVSAHLGDRAIVYADGRMEGFVGGACSREIVRKQALEALRSRQPRLVSIGPEAPTVSGHRGESGEPSEAGDRDHVVLPMSCVSEGAMDVYIEPFVSAQRIVVVGDTPVAEAFARIAAAADYDVRRVVESGLADLPDIIHSETGVAVVVASQGDYDEEALRAILGLRQKPGVHLRYVGLVASRKRGESVRRVLDENGVAGADAVRVPAGLDLGARTPAEVALSILAEVLQIGPGLPTAEIQPSQVFQIDPVCGMQVEVATARHVAEFGGRTYYFCSPNCRARFVEAPDPVVAARR